MQLMLLLMSAQQLQRLARTIREGGRRNGSKTLRNQMSTLIAIAGCIRIEIGKRLTLLEKVIVRHRLAPQK
ncbi:hypothetical protein ACU6QO_10605 [Aeromonas veronii]|uniref:hypothetical protein n=1 Tax=Aeromonas veronii TaxID=654 RepID=UPI00406C285A